MKICTAMQSHRATEQLEEGFVSNLPCMAQSFSSFKARWFPVPQVREAVMPAGGSQIGLTGALLDARNDEMHPFTSWLWASSIPAAMGRWQQALSCSLWIRGAHKSSLKQWEEAEALYSLSVPVLPWAHSLWVVGSIELSIAVWSCWPPFRHLPSPQAAWTGHQQKRLFPLLFWSHKSHQGFCQAIYIVFYCFTLFLTKSPSIPCQNIGW